MASKIEKIIRDFLEKVGEKESKIEIYNEFSLQHELGIFLRDEFEKTGDNYKVQFERNVKELFKDWNKTAFIKWEIDIVIFSENKKKQKKLIAAIELKFPRNGQYPEQMYSFCKDIQFAEQLSEENRFEEAYVLVLVDDKNFYEKTGQEDNDPKSIYKYFRKEENLSEITNKIFKPTGKGKYKDSINIEGSYPFKWEDAGEIQKKYFYDENEDIKNIEDPPKPVSLQFGLIKARA